MSEKPLYVSEKEHPPGIVALPVGGLARYHSFTMSIISLERPAGSVIHMMQSISVAANLNAIIRHMRPEHQWCFIQADDQTFEPDILWRLLDAKKDVIVPLIPRRNPPFSPVIFKHQGEDGRYMPFPWDEIPKEGPFEVAYAGSGGMLISRSAIERVIEAQGHDSVFEFTKGDILNEDMQFCHKLRELDPPIKIWCEPSARLGHCGDFVVMPQFTQGSNGDAGSWGLRFQMGEGPEGSVHGVFLQPSERTPEEAAAHLKSLV